MSRLKIDIPGGGFVELIDCMGTDLAVVNAARTSYASISTELSNRDEGLIRFLAEHKHMSPFRHTVASFRIQMPIFVARQWMKHKIGSRWGIPDDTGWNERSARYTQFDLECWDPEELDWRGVDASNTNKQGSDDVLDEARKWGASQLYDKAVHNAVVTYYNLLEVGVCKEQARAVLPMGMMTEVIWTASLEAVANFLQQRLDHHAQLEIQLFAHAVQELCQDIWPISIPSLIS